MIFLEFSYTQLIYFVEKPDRIFFGPSYVIMPNGYIRFPKSGKKLVFQKPQHTCTVFSYDLYVKVDLSPKRKTLEENEAEIERQ